MKATVGKPPGITAFGVLAVAVGFTRIDKTLRMFKLQIEVFVIGRIPFDDSVYALVPGKATPP
jgi:hypothetical protein